MEAPEEFKNLIGTRQALAGYLFGSSKEEPTTEYDILDWRWGSAKIMDMTTFKIIHPTVELLVKNKNMKASRWTKGFPCTSVKLEEDDEE